jgi:DNA-binding transcriptional LysR family regulator
MIDFDPLRAVLALARHHSLSAAARALDCPKSTLSRRIALVEQTLGHALTRQENGRLILTEAGWHYAGYCERILELADEGRRAVDQLATGISGELRIGISPEMTRGWISRALNEFLDHYPGLCLDVHVAHPGTLTNGTGLDLWIQCGEAALPGMKRLPLGRWERRIYTAAPPDSPCRNLDGPDGLPDCPWICLAGEAQQTILHHTGNGTRRSVRLTPRLRVASMQMLADCIARGYGIGILPSWLAECPRHGLRGQFSRVLDGWQAPAIELALYLPPGPRTRRCDLLVEHLHTRLPPRWALEQCTEGT